MMAKKTKKSSKGGRKLRAASTGPGHAARRVERNGALREFVAVAFARDEIEAKEYEALLAAEDIPVTIRQQGDDDGFSVMVPEEHVDEAYVVIESQDAFEDYYDDAEQGGIDFGAEGFDDEY